jgi:hypothetical protein
MTDADKDMMMIGRELTVYGDKPTSSCTPEIRGLRPKEKPMSEQENASGAQVPCISLLAPAWDKMIPPQSVRIVELFDSISGLRGKRPEWNPEWLIGLEQFVRAIVRDELSKANADLTGRRK